MINNYVEELHNIRKETMNINTVATPNRNRPDAIVITSEFYNEIKRIRDEIASNTASYKGKTDKQANTLEYIDGCLKNIRAMGSLTENQIKWLQQTSNVCHPKGNINAPIKIPSNLMTVSEYYTPKRVEEPEVDAELSMEKRFDMLVDLVCDQQEEINQLKEAIKILLNKV